METGKKTLSLAMAVATLAIMAGPTAPALAEHHEKPSDNSSASATGSIPAAQENPDGGQQGNNPGQAWRTVNGTITDVAGDIYTIEDYESQRITLYVGKGTKHLKRKYVGETIRAEITRSGFVNSIQ